MALDIIGLINMTIVKRLHTGYLQNSIFSLTIRFVIDMSIYHSRWVIEYQGRRKDYYQGRGGGGGRFKC